MRLRPALLGWPLLIVTILVVAVVTVGAVLISSQAGSRWLVQQAVAFAEVPLQIEGMQGTLLRGMQAERLHYRDDAVEVEATRLELSPDWMRSLTRDRIVVTRLAAATLALTMLERDPPPEAQPLELTLPGMPIALVIEEIELGHVGIDELPAQWAPALRGAMRWDRDAIALSALEIEAPNYRLTSPSLRLDLDEAQHIGGELDWRLFDGEYAGHALLEGTLHRLLLEHRLHTPFQVRTRGSVALLGRERPYFELESEAEEIAYEGAIGEGLWASVAGTLDDYAGELRAQAVHYEALDEALSGALTAAFTGDLERLELAPLELDSPAGELGARGTLAWRPALESDLEITGRRLDPAAFGAHLDGELSLEGRIRYADERLTAIVDALSGRFGEAALFAMGSASYAEGVWSSETIEIRSGANRISASGRFTEGRLQAELTLALARIEQLVPDFEGDLRGHARFEGRLDALTGTLAAHGGELRWQETLARGISLSAGRDEQGRNELALSVQELRRGEVMLRELVATGAGDDDEATLDLAWRFFDEAPSRVSVAVRRTEQAVALMLEGGAVLVTPYGSWQLDRDAEIELAAERLRVGEQCWLRRPEGGRVCLDRLTRIDEVTELAGMIDGLPVQSLALAVPELDVMDGLLAGNWQLRHDADAGTWDGNAAFATVGLSFAGFVMEEADAILELPELHGEVRFSGDHLDGTLYAEVNGERVVDLSARVDDMLEQQRLSGRIALSLADTSFLAGFVEDLAEFEGRLAGEVNLAGTLAAPQVDGRLELLDGAVVWLDPFVELQELTLSAELDDVDELRISGSAASGEGRLAIEGSLEQPLTPERALRMRLTGSDLLVRIPDTEVTAAPDLLLTWREGAARVTGSVTVPHARISAAELPAAAVGRSGDVIVIDREDVGVQPTQIAVNVRVILGDDVRLEGFGLFAMLRGDVRLQRTHEGATALHGRVDIEEGAFTAFGQTLEIDRGNVTYSGPPMNPYVETRAIRRIDTTNGTVLVGIHIRGELERLESTLFADPPMSEANALSYLMLGRPLEASTEEEGDQLIGAAVALGLRQAAPLIDEVRSALGLDELAVAGDGTEDLSLIAGRRINRRLYMRYSYQAFLGVSALLVRYDLTNRLSLETTASEAPGVDLMYRVTED